MVKENDPPERYRAPALDKGLDILELLSQQADALSRAEIVKAMGRSSSEIYRMLERLVARGYVARLAGGDRFALSMKLFVLATQHPHWRRLVGNAQPWLEIFAQEVLQSCHLVIPESGAAIVIAQASPLAAWEFRIRVGARLDLLVSNSGQTLLAFQDEARLSETLAIWGASALEPDALVQYRALQPVRDAGYRMGPSQQLNGIIDISVPVLAADGNAVAVVTCPYIGRPSPIQAPDINAARRKLCDLASELALD